MPPSEPASHRVTSKKLFLLGLKICISFGLLAFLLSKSDFIELKDTLLHTDPLFVLFALLTPYLGFYLTSLRWKGLLRAQNVYIRQPVLARSCMVAVFFNQILPSTIGGDLIRVYDSWKGGASKPVAVSAILIDRVFGLFALSLFAVGSLFLIDMQSDSMKYIPLAVMVVALGLAFTLFMVFSPKTPTATRIMNLYLHGPRPIAKFVTKLDNAVDSYRGNHSLFVKTLLLSLMLQFNVILMHYLLGQAIGITPSFVDYFYIVPISFFVMLIPLSINGIGIREGMFVLLLGTLGVAKPDALILAFLSLGVFLVHGLMGGVVLAVRGISPSSIVKNVRTSMAGDLA